MQKKAILLLAVCARSWAMESSLPSQIPEIVAHVQNCIHVPVQAPTVMVAAWVVTPQTKLDIHDEIIISKYPNGMYGIKHFSRPKGMRETRCELKTALEISTFTGEQALLLKQVGDELELVASKKAWYKHPITTHSVAVLSALLFMGVVCH